MKRVLGTAYEMSFRTVLLLDESKTQGLSTGMIAALDFIVVYAKDFGLAESNLHGNSNYRFGEFASRREMTKNAVRKLALDGIVQVKIGEMHIFDRLLQNQMDHPKYFLYSLSDVGVDFATTFRCDYANTYREVASLAISKFHSATEFDVHKIINQQAIGLLRRG